MTEYKNDYQQQHDKIQEIKKELHDLRNHIARNDKTHDVIVKQVVDITNFNQRKIAEFNRQSTMFIRLSFILSLTAVGFSLPYEWYDKAIRFLMAAF